jgi:hypothetical protein
MRVVRRLAKVLGGDNSEPIIDRTELVSDDGQPRVNTRLTPVALMA